MGVTPVILSGSVVIQNNPDTQIADPGNLSVSQNGAFGTSATVGTFLTVGTTITANGLMTGSHLNLVSNNTSSITGPLNLAAPTTSTSSGSFTFLNTTSSAAANTFNNPSSFLSSLSGVNGSFSSSISALFFNGTSPTLVSTIQGPVTLGGLLTANNKITTNGFTNTGISTLGGQVNYPNTYYTVTAQSSLSIAQGGTGIPGNVWRFRTNDTTNTGARMSLGNAGTGNTYYDSQFTWYGLGVIEGTTGNTERMTIGYNGTSGPYINQLYAGTGVARPLNIYNGALFSAGGALSLASTLNVIGQTTFGAQCNYPSNYYTYTAPISNFGNTFRFRSLDTTNVNVVNSLANSGVGPTVAYSSVMAFYGLGNTETNTANTEYMYVGASGTGGVIAPGATGTGSLVKPLNLYGTTLVNNGLVTMPAGLTVTAGNVSIGATTSSSSATSGALVVAGGAGIGGSIVVNGSVTTSSVQDSGPLYVGGASFFSNSLSMQMIAQPAVPINATTETFWTNTSGLLQSMGSDGIVTTFQPLTTPGDLLVHNGTTQTRLPKGVDNTVLIADSAASVGLSWQTITRNNVIIGNTSTVPVPKFLSKIYTGVTSGNNGQWLLYPTSTGLSGGSKIFSTINFVTIYVQGNNGSVNAQNAYWGSVQSQNATVCDLRILTGVTIGTLLLSVNPTIAYAPAGVAVTAKVEGVPL